MRHLYLTAICLVLIAPLRSQTSTAPGQDTVNPGTEVIDRNTDVKVDVPTVVQKERLAFEQAKRLIDEGKVAEAELVLAANNMTKANTPEFHMETAQRLMIVSEQSARNGEPAQVMALATRALLQLEQSETFARDPEERASAKTLAGFIQERYLADPSAALRSYRSAVQLSPDKAKKAQESIDRLQKTEEIVREKNTRGGGK